MKCKKKKKVEIQKTLAFVTIRFYAAIYMLKILP